jgi:hypothetical protein
MPVKSVLSQRRVEMAVQSYQILAHGSSGTLELDITGDVITGTVFGDPITGFRKSDGSVTFVRSGGSQTYQGWFQQAGDVAEYDGYFIDVTSGTPTRHDFAWRAHKTG